MAENAKIDFFWDFGDDERETLELMDEHGAPLNLSDYRLDLFIVPDNQESVIRLSTNDGTIKIKGNGEIEIIVSRKLTANSDWCTAKWDLKITSSDDWRDTLCGGNISRKQFYSQKRVEGFYDK